MDSSIFRISLDVHRQTTQTHLGVRKGDTARKIVASLSDGGRPYRIDEGCYAVFKGKKADGNVLFNNCTVTNNCIVYDFTEQTAASAGYMDCQLQLYGPDGKIITSPKFAIIVNGLVYDDGQVESAGEFTALTQAMADVAEMKANGLKGDPGPQGPAGPEGPQGKPLYVSLDVDVKTGGWSSNRTYDEILNKHEAQQEIICHLALNGGEDLELRLIQATPAALIFGAVVDGVEWQAVIRPGAEEFAAVEVTVTDYRSKSRATDEIYFDITEDGVISLKPEYRGACPIYHENFANGLSDYGEKLDGSQNKELPEEIVVPETVNGITVTAYAVGMFVGNNRIKRLALNPNIKEIPYAFCYNAGNLKEVVGTEVVEVLNGYAFTNSGILAAKFPNLKQLVDTHHFSCCIDLVVADLGTVITQIPKNCFAMCERLAELRIDSNVTSVADYGFYFTYRLKNLPFMSSLANVGKYGFLVSRVNCNWDSLTGTFGTLATPKDFCGADYWSACSFEKCITPLRSTFHQDNPLWVNKKIGNLDRTWDTGCIIVCAAMAYSALEDKDLSSPEEFTDVVYAADPTLKDVDPSNVVDGIERYLEAVGYDVVRYSEFNTANLQAMYDALADGAMVIHRCLAGQSGNHDVLIHGINADGEVLCVDSAGPSERVERYEAITYAMPIQNRTRAAEGTDKDWFWVVKKKEEA